MRFDSFNFVLFSIASIALLRLARPGYARTIAILVTSAFFFFSFIGEPRQALPLAGFLLMGYGAVWAAARLTSPLGYGTLTAAVVAVFVWLKQYTIVSYLPYLPFSYVTLGLSFILFRTIHLIVDVAQGTARVPRFSGYIGYATFFLTMVSGPIQRYQDFSDQMARPAESLTAYEVDLVGNRIIRGYFRFVVIAVCFLWFANYFQTRLYDDLALQAGAKNVTAIVDFSAAALTYFFYLYFNFSGYMDIVIGIGLLSGIQLPENFDAPFRSKNFLDFWARWHITLANWFKFYLFNPLLKVLAQRWGTPSRMPYLGVFAFLVTFVTMGLWHGTTNIFLFYGLFLGMGVSLNKLWQVVASQWLGKKRYRELCKASWYVHLSRAAALSYIAMALTCLWLSSSEIHAVGSTRGLEVGVAAFFLLTVSGAALFACMAFLVRATPMSLQAYVEERRMGWSRKYGAVAMAMRMAAKVVVIVILAVLLNSSPEFVYKGF